MEKTRLNYWKDNVVVIIRYGGTYVRVYESRFLESFKIKSYVR